MPVEGANVVAPERKEYEVLPADVYQAELLDIEAKMQKKWQSEEEELRLMFTFVIIEEGEYYGRYIWQFCSNKLSKFKGGSNLYKTVCGLMGRQLTDEEVTKPHEVCSDDALNALIGKQVRLSVSQKEKQDGTMKNVIDSFMPIKEEMPAYVQEEQEIDFDA